MYQSDRNALVVVRLMRATEQFRKALAASMECAQEEARTLEDLLADNEFAQSELQQVIDALDDTFLAQ